MTTQERRSFPRVRDERLSLSLRAGDFDTVTHTLNISASGLYCKVDREIPLMSRVKLALMLPETAKSTKSLEVDGVVVREHPVIIDGQVKHYDIAIFFDRLPEKARGAISNYINKAGTE
jgi:hypothetical protein